MTSSAPHGVAIIGLGTVGRRFVEQFGLHASFTVVGGWDASPDACEAAAADFGIAIADDAANLIADPAVNMVYIAVPPLHHELYVDMTQAAGKVIFCEKPLGVDDADSAAMVERVATSGLPAAVNFVFGSAPAAVELGRLLSEGQAGEIVGADLRVHFERWPRDWQAAATWLRDRDQGGWVREVVSHYVFLLQRLFGAPEHEHHTVRWPGDGTSETSLVATTHFGSVATTLFGTSDAAGGDEVQMTVRGTERSFRLTNWYLLEAADEGGEWRQVLDDDAISAPTAYAAQLGQLSLLCQGQPHTLATLPEALAVQSYVEMLVSSQTG